MLASCRERQREAVRLLGLGGLVDAARSAERARGRVVELGVCAAFRLASLLVLQV